MSRQTPYSSRDIYHLLCPRYHHTHSHHIFPPAYLQSSQHTPMHLHTTILETEQAYIFQNVTPNFLLSCPYLSPTKIINPLLTIFTCSVIFSHFLLLYILVYHSNIISVQSTFICLYSDYGSMSQTSKSSPLFTRINYIQSHFLLSWYLYKICTSIIYIIQLGSQCLTNS